MSETVDNNETNNNDDVQPQEDQSREQTSEEPKERPKDTVGDILHKERVTRRITLETIAKDLKLNIQYIKAIESNNFKELPADPYVRVYLRSIATYLMLDPDEILKKFFKDRGVPAEETESSRSERIKIDIEKDSKKHSKSWIIIIIVIVILAALSYVSKKMGWFASIPGKKEAASAVIDTTEESDEIESPDSLEEAIDDSTMQNDTVDTNETAEVKTYGETSKDSLKLYMRATVDSVWVQVFYDGKSWKNFIRTGNPRVFKAKDSLNLHVGINSLMRYTLNGKRLNIRGSGVKFFKIDHDGVKLWTLSKWNSVFKGRL
jgi:cytoskeletal protein RodZ